MELRQRSYNLNEGRSDSKGLVKKIEKADSIRELRKLAKAAEQSGSSAVSRAWHEREWELKHGGRREFPDFS